MKSRYMDKLSASLSAQDNHVEERFAKANSVFQERQSSVIRDTFSMPPDDYGLIDALRVRAARGGRNTQKGEVVRAALQLLATLDEAELVQRLNQLQKVPVGRQK